MRGPALGHTSASLSQQSKVEGDGLICCGFESSTRDVSVARVLHTHEYGATAKHSVYKYRSIDTHTYIYKAWPYTLNRPNPKPIQNPCVPKPATQTVNPQTRGRGSGAGEVCTSHCQGPEGTGSLQPSGTLLPRFVWLQVPFASNQPRKGYP